MNPIYASFIAIFWVIGFYLLYIMISLPIAFIRSVNQINKEAELKKTEDTNAEEYLARYMPKS